MSIEANDNLFYKLPRSTLDKLTNRIIRVNALVEIAACHNFHLNSKETTEIFFSLLQEYSQQVLEIVESLMQERCLCPYLNK